MSGETSVGMKCGLLRLYAAFISSSAPPLLQGPGPSPDRAGTWQKAAGETELAHMRRCPRFPLTGGRGRHAAQQLRAPMVLWRVVWFSDERLKMH